MRPRRAALAGLIFPVLALFYFVFSSTVAPGHTEPAAVVMLLALGVAVSLMTYVLFAAAAQN